MPQEINLNLFDSVLNIVINQAGYYGLDRELAMKRAEEYLDVAASIWTGSRRI